MHSFVLAMAAVLGVSPDELVKYIIGAFGTAFGVILSLLIVVWKQVEKQSGLITEHLKEQMKLLETRLTECRNRDDESHRSFHVDLEKLKESHSEYRRRLAVLEDREGIGS